MVQSDTLSRRSDLCPDEDNDNEDIIMLPDDMFLNLIDTNLQEKIAMSNDLDGNAAEALKLLLEQGPTTMTVGLNDWTIETQNGRVMNHIPLHPFAIKSHPTLIPSLPNLPPMFPPFPHFQTLHHFVAPSLVASSPVTRHPSPVTSSLRHSVFIILHYQFPSLPSFVISDLFHPIKFQALFSVMWLDDHHLTSLHSCGEQLFYCSSDLMTSFLVILFSTRLSPYFCI